MVATLDPEAAVAAWRRAEARVYPTVMVNADLYQQYIGVVRAVAEELAPARTVEDLVAAWHEQRDLVRAVVERDAPPMLGLMDLGAVRDAAFCHRHRALTREHGKRIAAERLEAARRDGATWVLLFDDVTPMGSHRLEMHVASGRALHASSELPLDAARPRYTLEVVQLDPRDGAWLVDRSPIVPAEHFETHAEWEAHLGRARTHLSRS